MHRTSMPPSLCTSWADVRLAAAHTIVEYRTDGGTGLSQSAEDRAASSGPNCRLKPASSQSRIYTDVDGWPSVCGPKTCKDVVDESFHFDSNTGLQGWQVLGNGVTTHAQNFGQDSQSHVYQAHDCPPTSDCSEDPVSAGFLNHPQRRRQ